MLFLTTVKVFLSSVSFKALMVLKGFRNRERLGTKLRLRAWAPESCPESISSPEQEGVMNLGLGTKEVTDDRLTRALRPS